jgi:hypothetical protein
VIIAAFIDDPALLLESEGEVALRNKRAIVRECSLRRVLLRQVPS